MAADSRGYYVSDISQEGILPPNSQFSFFTGEAGTGKTTLARQWSEDASDAILCSTTGISAINLGGSTINALVGFFDTESLRDIYLSGRLHATLRKLRDAGTSWYLLDEVSMMPADQLTYLARAIREINHTQREGGVMIKLTVIGDFGQLSPVNEPFAFESPEWERVSKHTIRLTEIKRQADIEFIRALQAVRRGDATAALDYFGPKLQPMPKMDFPGVMIFGKNDQVSRHNELMMDQVSGTPVSCTKVESGQPRGEWKLIPHNLYLKVGALVMLLANKRIFGTTGFQYANGDLGELLEMENGRAIVKLQRTGNEVVVEPVTRKNQRPLAAGRRQELINAGRIDDISGKYEVVGRVTYMPLRAAWSSTVHKCQGLSFDHAQIDIRNHFFTQPAMLYVALSRARTAEGLRIIGNANQFRKRCVVDERTRPWL
jgi:ATP-dependent DNA helicase PIF1